MMLRGLVNVWHSVLEMVIGHYVAYNDYLLRVKTGLRELAIREAAGTVQQLISPFASWIATTKKRLEQLPLNPNAKQGYTQRT